MPDDRFEAAAGALEAAGAADLDEREAACRREGWTGAAVAATAASRQNDFGTSPAAVATTGTGGGEERIPVVEERQSDGKREVGHGRVRVRSHVVETTVQEQVTLREEHVSIERRPVAPPVAVGDDALREHAVEATESGDEAVVSKKSRVTEEVAVRKRAEERTEIVSDAVRRTEVEVEDGRGRPGGERRPDRG